MFKRMTQSRGKFHQLERKNGAEMGGGHDSSPFIPYHIFAVKTNFPTHLHRTSTARGETRAQLVSRDTSFTSFTLSIFHSCGFYPLKWLLSTGKTLSQYETPSSERKRDRLLTKLIIQRSAPAQLQDM